MKGKTGKSAMRGGGMARKGVGVALRGGGMARKGVGMALADGGVPNLTKEKKAQMVGGYSAQQAKMSPNKMKSQGAGRVVGGYTGPQTAVPAPKTGSSRFKDGGKTKKMAMGGNPGAPTVPTTAAVNPAGRTLPMQARAYGLRNTMTRPGFISGPVVRRADGGAIKMTAGAGSGSGRLEKVAAHKSAKRVPAQNLKSGGKVKGK